VAWNTDNLPQWSTGTPVFCLVGVRALVFSCSSAKGGDALRGHNHAAPALDEQITR
jgi:hypothetical protein